MRPLVTIAIPTFNRAAQSLRLALESALAQTYPNLEILVSDNASTDHTENLVRGYTDPRIRYVRHPQNIGANQNFNFCVTVARGVYLLLLHDDDLIDVDFVATCMNAAGDDTSFGVIRTGMRVIDGEGKMLAELPNRVPGSAITDFLHAWYNSQTSPYCCNTLCNVARLREIGGYRSRHNLFQDALAQFRLAVRFGQVDVLTVKASFRRHDQNMGAAARIADWCDDSLEFYDTICQLVPEQPAALREEGKRFFCRINYGYVALLKSPLQRAVTYVQVARAFDHVYPAFRFAWDKDLRPRLRRLKRQVASVLVGSTAH